ncbi:hypothetical protein SUGI_0533510 [Cryptomeria japonica]|nr:hypothetical protein SUGI_0533510 [Cryptomeria japonica]
MRGGSISTVLRVAFVMSFMGSWYCCMGDKGTASFYFAHFGPTACYGNDTSQIPEDNNVARASDAIWDNGAACGRQYNVTCTGTMDGTIQGSTPITCKNVSVVVKIVDNCSAGCRGTIDLAQNAFEEIAVPAAGEVYIDYEQ